MLVEKQCGDPRCFLYEKNCKICGETGRWFYGVWSSVPEETPTDLAMLKDISQISEKLELFEVSRLFIKLFVIFLKL